MRASSPGEGWAHEGEQGPKHRIAQVTDFLTMVIKQVVPSTRPRTATMGPDVGDAAAFSATTMPAPMRGRSSSPRYPVEIQHIRPLGLRDTTNSPSTSR